MKNIKIFDSTLRDGAQSEAISFSVEDKLSIVRALDNIGVSYIEAGNPYSNPKDIEFFKRADQLSLKHSELVAFGSTRRKNISADEDPNLKSLLSAETPAVAIFGKSWLLHVTEILQTDAQTNLDMISDTVRFLKSKGKTVIYDAEHFFDGCKSDRKYALETLRAAYESGADYLVLCDTNGASLPNEIQKYTADMCKIFPGKIGIHTHNDCGLAAANSIVAVEAGAVQVQGTFLGFGERCGNCSLSTVIPNLQLKMGFNCIPNENMSILTETARSIAEISNISIRHNEPFIGASAFAHKAGMHADGVLKLPKSFEHIDPSIVGNERKILTSEIAGRGSILQKINKINPHITKDSEETAAILNKLKALESAGYQFEGAEASFEMLIRRELGAYKKFFEIINYKIMTGRPCEENFSATAVVKIRVDEKTQVMAAEGNGPINAFDRALRFALEVFYPRLTRMRLIDYKVRVMDSKQATASSVRVLITSTDGKQIWSTVGVSGDVVDASRIALVESVEYKLHKDLI